jgi:hypothetical protein
LHPPDLAALDKWIARQQEEMTRPEALRAMMAMVVELGLSVKTSARQSGEGPRRRAREMAGAAIDKMADTAATLDDQASRKKRLIKGPEEFQGVRKDRAK